MGAIFTTVEVDGQVLHRSTGKYPFPAGYDHVPEWGR